MAEQLILPRAVLDANGDPISGAKLTAFLEGTTTAEIIYSDEALTTAHPSPLVADAGGNFPPIWHAGDHGVKIVITDASDVDLDWSPLDPCPMTASATTASNIAFTPIVGNPASNVQDALANVTNVGQVQERNISFTIVASDFRKTFRVNTDITATLTAAETLGNGFIVYFDAAGGDVSFSTTGSDSIDVDTLHQGQSGFILCDGQDFSVFLFSVETSVLGVGSSSGTVNIGSRDYKSLIQVDDDITLTLGAPADLGNGFWFDVEAISTATIDGDGALINGDSTLTLLPGEFARIFSTGGLFVARVTPAQPTIINITSSTAVDAYDVPAGATGFILKVESFIPATANGSLCLQYGVNGSGGAFVTSSNYFTVGGNNRSSSASPDAFDTTDTVAFIGRATTNLATFSNSSISQVECFGLRNASGSPKLLVDTYGNSTTENVRSSYAGRMTGISITDVDAVRFLADTGNIAELKATLTWVRGVA